MNQTLDQKQIKREARLDVIMKDLHKVEVIRCLADNLTSMDWQPGAPAPSIDCGICVYSALCLEIRQTIAKL